MLALCSKIARDLDKFTVIATVLQVLEGHMQAIPNPSDFLGLTAAEIGAGFNTIAKRLGKKCFFHTYVQRHAKDGDYFIGKPGNRYAIRPELLEGLTGSDLQDLSGRIRLHLDSGLDAKTYHLRAIADAKALPGTDVAGRKAFLVRELSQLQGNAGQTLEIYSFAVLGTYMRILGFSLRRFSTTFANDGGMDFIAENGFYQVTATPSARKLAEDCRKLPGACRVLVAPKLSPRVLRDLPASVLGTIEGEDLTKHFLGWLAGKDERRGEAFLLQEVLDVAQQEFERE